jgi:ribonuclease Z
MAGAIFSVTILGTLAAMPDMDAITSAQVLNVRDHHYLVDCAEGTQMKLHKYGIKRNRIRAICISHLHGDHLFGLPGLLTSFSHFQRTESLTILGPTGIKSYIENCLTTSQAFIGYNIDVTELEVRQMCQVFEDAYVKIEAFPLKHRIPTCGYRFEEKLPVMHMNGDLIRQHKLTVDQIKALKEGRDLVLEDGTLLRNDEVVFQKYIPRTYAYCSDTVYDEEIASFVSGVDVLYHEATYANDMAHKAEERMHATAAQAAWIAQKAKVSELILGHFSSRYGDRKIFLDQATAIFGPTRLAGEGISFEVPPKFSNILEKNNMQ